MSRLDVPDASCAEETCPVARAVRILDGKWTILVIRDLLRGTKRFSELRSSLTGISPKTLTDRLRDLEGQGLVERAIYAEIPPRVEYSLTHKGRTLEPVISALAAWGRSADEPADAPGAS
jgi:DNA-binding HxlR family transcriptional regulator